MFDASAFAGVWPFRPHRERTLAALVHTLSGLGVRGACISPVEAILHPEPMTANRRLFEEAEEALRENAAVAAGQGFEMFFAPVIDPTLATWREHLDECLSVGGERVRAVKIVPNYHGYSLAAEPAVGALARAVAERNLALCIQVRMEDERSRHVRTDTVGVPAAEIAAFAGRHPALRILVCGGYMTDVRALAPHENLAFEMSFVESGNVLGDALRLVGAGRLLAGTHAPLLMPAVGLVKPLADEAAPDQVQAMTEGNYRRIFAA